ncbi:MAG: T9SS C-terminal target domain-containing protein [Bacteroidetes bacterium]|nr:MAG: T9SS C-terminal target domain-containing protein [Bacteroidota bacterium]
MKKLILPLVFIVPFALATRASAPAPADTAHWYMEHSYDVLQYKLEVDLYANYTTPYPKTFTATEFITFRVDSTLHLIKLNAISTSLEVDSVGMAATSFTHDGDTLTLQLDQTYNPGAIVEVKVSYRHLNVADQGLYVSNGFVFTDFPPEGARKVLPCWDRPSDKAKWDFTARVPVGVRLGSTGYLADSTIVADTLWYHWVSDNPVATYLITWTSYTNWNINISYWNNIYDPSDSIPIWLYKKPTENITSALEKIPLMTDLYADKFGPYPFSKIGFATITTFPWAGMENQTMVNLKPNGYSDEPLIAHEHSHMWFGDLITCGTWADIWLNEGFATYCAQLWLENQSGYFAYKNKMNSLANNYLSSNPGWPIYNPDWAIHTPSANALYNVAISYNKGACVLFQLRYVLGDSLFFAVLNAYATDTNFSYKNAVTEDFVAVTNAVTGEDYTWFFNEWVYAPNHPYYENVWEREDLGGGQFRISLEMNQTQTNTVFFKMPIEVQVDFNDGTDTIVTGWNDTNPQILEWTFDKYPSNVIFDPYRNILLKLGTTIVGTREPEESGFLLRQNNPNPFRDQTTITYSVPSEELVSINLLDNTGKIILTPVYEVHQPGEYFIIVSGKQLPAGIYFCRLEAGTTVRTIKLIIQ